MCSHISVDFHVTSVTNICAMCQDDFKTYEEFTFLPCTLCKGVVCFRQKLYN